MEILRKAAEVSAANAKFKGFLELSQT